MTSLESSYAHCRQVARSRARNFYYSFVLLSKPQRDAMCAIYAFMRRCDDLSDEPGATREALEDWRSDMHRALQGRYGSDACWPALHDAVRRYSIPAAYLDEMIDGVESDLEPRHVQTFEELYRYCYLVASVAGLCAIHIFGFESRDALPLAEKCGIAFQLTNILRDVREDAARGRVYLPAQDLDRFGVSVDEVLGCRDSERLRRLLAFEAQRARVYYEESAPLLGMIDPSSRASLRALVEIYQRLLDRIERAGFDVLPRRIRLSAAEKIAIMLRAAIRSRSSAA
jgi:phytoene synthase